MEAAAWSPQPNQTPSPYKHEMADSPNDYNTYVSSRQSVDSVFCGSQTGKFSPENKCVEFPITTGNSNFQSTKCTQDSQYWTGLLKNEDDRFADDMNQQNYSCPLKLEPPEVLEMKEADDLAAFESTGDTIDSIEIYHDLIMRHLVQDIQSTSTRLGIPTDPLQWTLKDTQIWLKDVAQQYNLSNIPDVVMNSCGSVLCSVSLDLLKCIYPDGAELIHAQLNLWVTASDFKNRLFFDEISEKQQRIVKHQMNFIHPWINSTKTSQNMHIDQVESCSTFDQKPSCFYGNDFLMPVIMGSPSSDSGISTDEYEDINLRGCSRSAALPSSTVSTKNTSNFYFQNNNIHLWQFLREVLDYQEHYTHCVRWIDRNQGIFKIEDSHRLAQYWGLRKNRPAMNYDKLSRSLRQYYRKGILMKTARSQRLVYQFLPPYHIC